MVKIEVPSMWKSVRLGEIGHFNKGKGISNDDKGSGNIPCLSYGEIYTKHNEYIKEFHSFISAEVAQISYKLKKGDLLFTCSGETKEEIGKCVAFIDDFEAYAGGDIIIISPTKEINSIFMGFLLNTYYVVKQKASYGQGDSIVHISRDSIERIIIYLPPLSEQHAIAEILKNADKLIAVKKRLIIAKQKQKQWLMQKLLTGKIRLPGFSEEWEIKKLSNCVSFYNGVAHEDIVNASGCYILVTSKSISTELQECRNVSERLFPLYVDDIVMVMSDIPNGKALAKCLLITENEKYTLNQRICCFRKCSENVKYLFYKLNRNKYFLSFDGGQNQTNLRKDEILNCRIAIPPLPEQQAIANVLTTADREIELLKKELEQQKKIKKYLMQKLLTGKIRVKNPDAVCKIK